MEDLEDWGKKLDDIFDCKLTDDSYDLALSDTVKEFKLIKSPFKDMVGGMAMDMVKERYETFDELEVYCYRVAGTVGVMTLPILGFDPDQNTTQQSKDETIQSALALGLALQLTNILRDVGEDARDRARIYLPLEDLRAFNIEEEEIFKASRGELELWKDQRWVDFMEFQMARCFKYYEQARIGIIGLEDSSRLGVMTAAFVYGEILDVIRINEYNNFTQRSFVTLAEKTVLIAKSWLAIQELKLNSDEDVKAAQAKLAGTLQAFGLSS